MHVGMLAFMVIRHLVCMQLGIQHERYLAVLFMTKQSCGCRYSSTDTNGCLRSSLAPVLEEFNELVLCFAPCLTNNFSLAQPRVTIRLCPGHLRTSTLSGTMSHAE